MDTNNSLTNNSDFRQFLFVQSKQIDLAMSQVSSADQQNKLQAEIMLKSLEVKSKRIDTHSNLKRHKINWACSIIIFAILAFCFFIGYILHLGDKDVAFEIIKAVIYIFVGGAGGYGIGRTRKKLHQEELDAN